ncbi:MAG TPA: EutN/CcmL family microcompartment protein [Bacteroidota bacterium]|jgi:microcompartment protein CcmK/EutM|nr:EutN/CcmL family microcompartment protein [Bacteroidota bacterium]
MILCKITGTVVATQKNEHLKSYKILIAQPIDLSGKPIGRDILAIDSVDAGTGDTVLVVQEGQGAVQVLKNKKAPVHSVVVAVVDDLEVAGE